MTERLTCTASQSAKSFPTMTNGIKAITSDFGSENLGSIPGWSTQEAR